MRGQRPTGTAAPLHARQQTFLRRFVGRQDELEAFRTALDDPSGAITVLALHGPGGIGKTTLLRHFALEGARRGRDVVEVDGERTEPTEEAFRAAVPVTGTAPPVLLVDSVDRLEPLADWIRDQFLLRLPPGSVVVFAGRLPPSLRWQTDPSWADTLRVHRLGGLSLSQSARLLRDSTPGRVTQGRARLAFADGHPLALRLVGQGQDTPFGGEWQPSPEIVRDFLERVLGPVPSAVHRQALEICAHVPDTTEDLLRVFLPDDTHELFGWIRHQPYALSRRAGLRLLPVVAEALDRDLRWRAPDTYLSMHKSVRTYLQHVIRNRPEPASLRAAGAFNYLQTRGRRFPGFEWDEHDDAVDETPCGPDDVRAVRDFAYEQLGTGRVAAVDFWLGRQAAGFHLYRSVRTGDVVGVLGVLSFDRWDAVETVIDPVVAAARDHIAASRELRPGQQVDLVRFALASRRAPELTATSARMAARVTWKLLRHQQLEWTMHAVNDVDEQSARLLEFADFRQLPRGPRLAEQRVRLFAHDWGTHRGDEWSDLLDDRMFFGLRTPGVASLPSTSVLSRASFDRAVHDALRDWHQRERLATNPLLHASFVASRPGDQENLRRLIVGAIKAIDKDPKAKMQRAVVWATYVRGGSTQQAVAREFSLSFSTYRRYLKRGIERACWHLWEQEVTYRAQAAVSHFNTSGPATTW
ncbi:MULTISPECIES: ATP-binding protein [unclassified Streptomyces]|uniref:ATP-binding protein n=1 Tax=unclassified Streptomyces TaxID=2593676 RepID=UPI0037F60A26